MKKVILGNCIMFLGLVIFALAMFDVFPLPVVFGSIALMIAGFAVAYKGFKSQMK